MISSRGSVLAGIFLCAATVVGCGEENVYMRTETGGAPASAGARAVGGTAGTGGAKTTAGHASTGGGTGTGGNAATGGAMATGGATAAGAKATSTGGATATGGHAATGGAKTTGTGGAQAAAGGVAGRAGTGLLPCPSLSQIGGDAGVLSPDTDRSGERGPSRGLGFEVGDSTVAPASSCTEEDLAPYRDCLTKACGDNAVPCLGVAGAANCAPCSSTDLACAGACIVPACLVSPSDGASTQGPASGIP